MSLARQYGRSRPAISSATSSSARLVIRIRFTKAGTYKVTASATGPSDIVKSASGTMRVR